MVRYVIAHQGGWDEFLMFAVPVALGVWALRLAERKARKRAESEERAATGDGADPAQSVSEHDEA